MLRGKNKTDSRRNSVVPEHPPLPSGSGFEIGGIPEWTLRTPQPQSLCCPYHKSCWIPRRCCGTQQFFVIHLRAGFCLILWACTRHFTASGKLSNQWFIDIHEDGSVLTFELATPSTPTLSGNVRGNKERPTASLRVRSAAFLRRSMECKTMNT